MALNDWENINSGNAVPINGCMPLQVAGVNKFIAPDGSHWLKSGVAETDSAAYPSATKSVILPGNLSINALDNIANPEGITYANGFLYALGVYSDSVFKYTLDGTYAGEKWSVASEESAPRGICFDGEFFWVVGTNRRRVYQYTAAGVHTGFSFSTDTIDGTPKTPEDITFDGTNLWILTQYSSQSYLYEFYKSGTKTGRSINVHSTPRGVCFDGEFFWATFSGLQYAKKYSYAGDTGEQFYLSGNGYVNGIATDKSGRFFTINNNSIIRDWSVEVGMYESIDTDTQLPIYMRIK